MKQSKLFSKTLRKISKEEKSINTQLLIRAGFINKLTSGVYNLLSLGLKVHKKIEQIIREEMDRIGGEEVYLAALHPRENWERTGRWPIKEIFKLKSQSGKEYALSWTHEEVIVPLAKNFLISYKNLPKYVYQIQVKMRDELRTKSGLLRTREFIMKDLYSFHDSEEDLNKYYEKVKRAYFKIFQRSGFPKNIVYLTLAGGGTFSPYSHEFQVITDSGEDIIYVCRQCNFAINKDVKSKYPSCPQCDSKKFEEKRSVEVGNIFKLGTKFSQLFNLKFKNKKDEEKPVFIGCYGIGLGRLMGVAVEVNHDDRGIMWPKAITPFDIHLIEISSSNPKTQKKIRKSIDKVYLALQKSKITVLYDDRQDRSPGEKFIDSDLIGIPNRIVISEKTLKKECIELKERKKKKTRFIKIKNVIQSPRKIIE